MYTQLPMLSIIFSSLLSTKPGGNVSLFTNFPRILFCCRRAGCADFISDLLTGNTTNVFSYNHIACSLIQFASTTKRGMKEGMKL